MQMIDAVMLIRNSRYRNTEPAAIGFAQLCSPASLVMGLCTTTKTLVMSAIEPADLTISWDRHFKRRQGEAGLAHATHRR